MAGKARFLKFVLQIIFFFFKPNTILTCNIYIERVLGHSSSQWDLSYSLFSTEFVIVFPRQNVSIEATHDCQDEHKHLMFGEIHSPHTENFVPHLYIIRNLLLFMLPTYNFPGLSNNPGLFLFATVRLPYQMPFTVVSHSHYPLPHINLPLQDL